MTVTGAVAECSVTALKYEVGRMEKNKTANSSRAKGGRYLLEEGNKKPSRYQNMEKCK